MTRRPLLLVATMSALALALASSATQAQVQAEAQAEAPEEPMFVDLAGRTVHLSDHRGEILLVNFWATWCGPCRAEMPVIARLQEEFGPKGLRVIGPSANGRSEGELVQRMMSQWNVRFEAWLWVSAKDMAYYGVGPGIPATILVDRQGSVRHRFQGIVDEARIRPLVEALIAESARPPERLPEPLETRTSTSPSR